jgi:translation initiation factor IF-2
MTKMRVHELAKELGMENKEIMDMLAKKNVEIKSHMSSLEDDVVADIRKKGKSNSAGQEAKVAESGNSGDDAAPKKKNIVQVFRPQNSKSGSRMQTGQQRPQGNRDVQRSSSSSPRPQGSGQPAQGHNGTTQRPAGTQSQRPAGTQSQRPAGTQYQRPAGTQSQRPAGTQSQRPAGAQSQRPAGTQYQRPQGYRDGQRPQGNRDGQRPQGNRDGQRPQGNRDGQRPAYQGYQRTPVSSQENRQGGNYQGQRSSYSQNQRPGEGNQNPRYNNNRGPRPAGGPGGQDRSFGRNQDRNFGGPGNRNAGNGQRPGGQRDGKREDRDTISTPLVDQQKAQRSKAKDKEKEYKKKEYKKDGPFDNKNKKGKRQKPVAEVAKPQPKPVEKKEEIKQIILPEILTIKELADKMKIVPSVIVKKLFLQGKVVTVNQEVDYSTAEEIAMEFDVLCEKEVVIDVIEELLKEEEEDQNIMVKRPPVVCVMGHVDHGKTSLLDAIRHTDVIGREAGGITQHIGAYVVESNGEKITFLDTPGHEAFTAMRMRGANSTDIAILVVAADDGVMPQTVEAINHAKAAGIEIIVAINKIDKPSANIDRVKQELAEYELIPEDWGGSTIFVPVSAHTKDGIKELLEMILLTAEVMELKANADRSARGLVIEAELDKGKGSVATVLVQKGTLRVGDAIAAGSAHGKVRAMMDDKGHRVKEAGPSQPVEILGLNGVPNAGEVFVGCETEKEARSFSETFISQNKVKLLEDTKARMSLDDLFNQIKEGNLKELNIVVKADVQGSVEALKQSLLKLSNNEVVIKIIHGGVGAINESDVILASASNAIIIGFNVRPDATAKEIADRERVDLRLYRVIYSAIEDVEAAMKGMLDPIFEEKVLGHAEVRQTFKASGVGTIAGSYVLDGIFERGCSVRLTRDGIVIFDGPLASLKRFKDDVKEVRTGYECGFVFDNFNDIKEGDLVEAYKMVEIERK